MGKCTKQTVFFSRAPPKKKTIRKKCFPRGFKTNPHTGTPERKKEKKDTPSKNSPEPFGDPGMAEMLD